MKIQYCVISTLLLLGSLVASPSRATTSVSKADEAVKHAQAYRGTSLNVIWNKGLMAKEILLYSAPLWEKLTGIKINVIELAIDEVYPSVSQEHFFKSYSYDVISIVPNRLPDYINLGAIEPLDAYLQQFNYKSELQDIAPSFRDNWMTFNGQTYTIPDDGDVLMLYYRKDLFSDPTNKKAFLQQFGYPLAPPKTWLQFDQIAAFFTDKLAPEVYGTAFMHNDLSHYFFSEQFRNNKGVFFDSETMKTTINSKIAIKTLTQMVNRQKWMPPKAGQWSFMDVLSSFISGQVAMVEFWPPLGRWSEGYGLNSEHLSWVPKSDVAGKVGYAVTPGQNSALAAGFSLSISSQSKNKQAAYLFIQWMTSKEISLDRVKIPYSLRDPYRTSHFNDPSYRELWAGAGEYLDTLEESSKQGLIDLSLLEINLYEKSLTEGLKTAFTKQLSPTQALNLIAQHWDRITYSVGLEKQKKYYIEWKNSPFSYPKDK
ncbi:extracellular solute-binding protein [Psychromonas hadalis]|uniref:extracellular solute-binding protein n=1 Tax=Psychromonas hadalis TaxID=211669 RepID=UPI0003B41B17|nr:extracellular solute-binding protein [Psychromonas hadalis]